MKNRLFKKRMGKGNISFFLALSIILIIIFGGAFALYYFKGKGTITTQDIQAAEKILGLKFTHKELKMMRGRLEGNLSSFKNLRKIDLQNHIPPSFQNFFGFLHAAFRKYNPGNFPS